MFSILLEGSVKISSFNSTSLVGVESRLCPIIERVDGDGRRFELWKDSRCCCRRGRTLLFALCSRKAIVVAVDGRVGKSKSISDITLEAYGHVTYISLLGRGKRKRLAQDHIHYRLLTQDAKSERVLHRAVWILL
jgi:hypothetical protein